MPLLWRMNLNKRKKILVMLMFGSSRPPHSSSSTFSDHVQSTGVGSFVTIVSILRLHMLVYFGDSKNLTCELISKRAPTEILIRDR